MIGRRVDTFDDIDRAGDYCLGTIEDHGTSKRCVWFLLPIHEGETKYARPTRGSAIHAVYEPPWTFRECPDGSVEIRASIACGRSAPVRRTFTPERSSDTTTSPVSVRLTVRNSNPRPTNIAVATAATNAHRGRYVPAIPNLVGPLAPTL